MFKSLKVKLLAFFFITNIIILLGFSIFIYCTAQKGISDTLDTLMKIISIDAVADLKTDVYGDAKDVSDELIAEFGIAPLYIKIIHYDKKAKKILHETISSEEFSYLFKIALNKNEKVYHVDYFDKENYRISSMLVLEDATREVFFQLATKKTVNSPYLEIILISLIIANPIILILFLFIANVLIDRTLRPVKKVVSSVQSISTNNLDEKIDCKNIPSEIKELVETFNFLLFDLQESFKRISSFSSDASHELKTPLTVIRGEIEVALRKNRSVDEYKTILEDLLSETLSIQETIEQLFLLSKKDTAELYTNFEDIYLDELLGDVLKSIEKFATQKSIAIKMHTIFPLTIYANEALLKIAISNLLRNALIYSDEFTEIQIYMIQKKECTQLIIEDKGYGISAQDLPFVFDRFYRVDKVRSRKDAGTGLGLAIVKMILDIHHYEIFVKSVLHQGTRIIIKIPYK